MPGQPQLRTMDDLLNDLMSRGIPHRDAVLQTIREIENGDIASTDPEPQHRKWIVEFLQSLANWKPGARPPTMLFGMPGYLDRVRFYRPEPVTAARRGAGRPAEIDWIEADEAAAKLLNERGDPTDPKDKTKGWRSKSDLARAVLDHFEQLAAKNGEKVPALNKLRDRSTDWIETHRSRLAQY